MSPRIALCLSGQMRAYRLCHGSLTKYLLEPLQPDVFVHTWSNSGLALFNHHSGAFAEEVITYDSLEVLYHPRAAVIEEFLESYADELHGIKAPEALKLVEPRHYKSALPMFYKLFACNALKSAHEKTEGFTYDLVIRMRPDLMLEEQIPEEILSEPETLWFSDYSITLDFQVSDKLLLASSKIMNAYSDIWDRLNDYWRDPLGDGSPREFRVGERLAFYHVKHLQLLAKPFQMACFIERGRPGIVEEWRTTLGAV